MKAGHRMVAQGWDLFEEVVKDAGVGDLPQLLRSIKTMTTPLPATPPPKMDVSGVTPLPVKKEPGTGEEPVYVKVGGEVHYSCPQCDKVTGSKYGCDAHIREVHTGKALVCAYCKFSTYNMDSLNRHQREHN